MCIAPTWPVEEIFDPKAKQRGRDARFTVHFPCYCLQPKHIIVQRLWQRLPWVWMKYKQIKMEEQRKEQCREEQAANFYSVEIVHIYFAAL